MSHKTTKQLLLERKKLYQGFKPIQCKPIQSQVVFNRHGWNHVLYKGNGRRRNDGDLRRRLHGLMYVPEIIRLAMNATQTIAEENIGGNVVPVTYTKLHGVIGHEYICVILRSFPDSSPHYYSVQVKTKHKKRP